jgi:hypothetical protein
MGWKWIPLMEVDLVGSKTVPPGMTLEQQCHLCTFAPRDHRERPSLPHARGAEKLDHARTLKNRKIISVYIND